jgi:RimJ/RimL family protein N-acetyltransferase
MPQPDLNLSFGDGLHMRMLVPEDAALVAEGLLVGAVGLMPDGAGSIELAYWIRPEQRGRGIASRAVRASTLWAHRSLATSRIWLEIDPGNEPSLRVARRAGYHFEQRLPEHCRDWSREDAERDSWHDCLIWVHHGDQAPPTAIAASRGRSV